MRTFHRWLDRMQQQASQRRASADAYFMLALLLCIAAADCGGGGSSGMPAGGPPPPMFANFDAPGAGTTAPQGTLAFGINASGSVVGYLIDPTNTIRAFVRGADGTVTTFAAPGARTQMGVGTEAVAINSAGTIAGFFVDQANVEHSYIRTPEGTITLIDPPGSVFSAAVGINDAGTVVGRYALAGPQQAYIRSTDGTFSAFVIPMGQSSLPPSPAQINAAGAIVGRFLDSSGVGHGFLLDSTLALTILDAPGAGSALGEGTAALDINGDGVVVGFIDNGAANGLAVLHSFMRAADGTYSVFDPPGAGPNGSLADGVNDSGTIVGSYIDAKMVRHGYLRNPDGTFVTFDDPDAAQLPATFVSLGTAPRRVNASGAVVGLYTDGMGVRHGFVRQ